MQVLEIVRANPLDRKGNFNFLLRHIPAIKSNQIKKIVITTIPLIGDKIAKNESKKSWSLVFIVVKIQ